MTKRNSSIVLSNKERAPELGHRMDPHQQFRSKFTQQPGRLLCNHCGAIGFHKRWYVDVAESENLKRTGTAQAVLCPGCTRIDEGIHEGEVILESLLLASDKDALMGLIKHTEGKCWHDNPFARIASIAEEGGRMEIRTTTRWLATRIGKELHKAFKGELEIKPIPREKFVRVYWSQQSPAIGKKESMTGRKGVT